MRRYPAIGGAAAWALPAVCAALALAAVASGELALLPIPVAAALLVDALTVVFETSPHALSRIVVLKGYPLGMPRVARWEDVSEIRTFWRAPTDYTGLVTTVVARDGETFTFGTRMGLGAYRALVCEIAERAPHARRVGLTEQLLAESTAEARAA